MIRLEPLNPETPKRLVALPYAGWAASIIRETVDPYWGLDGERDYKVDLVRGEETCSHCGCDCNPDAEYKTVEVVARSADEAAEIAQELHPGWDEYEADRPRAPNIAVPEEYLKQFEVTR